MDNKVNFGSKKVDLKEKPKLVSDVLVQFLINMM